METYEVGTGVGLGADPDTGARTAVPVVTITAPKPIVAMTPDQALLLAENMADGAEAATLDAQRVQAAIDAGETSDDVLARLAQGKPDLSVVPR